MELQLLMRMLRPEPGERLLDVGCGTGYFARRFAREAGMRVTGLDPNLPWLTFARSQSSSERFVAGGAERLPFRDRSFDRTISITALCFIAEQREALQEMVRVTRTRLVLGLLNRRSVLYLQKGRRGGAGGYRGAHWHTPHEARCLFEGLPVHDLELKTAVFLPSGGAIARVIETQLPDRSPFGGFLAVAASPAHP